jgi:hypothetical protein
VDPQKAKAAAKAAFNCFVFLQFLVDLIGIEPMTSSMP